MNLLRSICSLFGGECAGEQRGQTNDTARKGAPADLGQEEAELEKTGKEQMSHMEGDTSSTPSSGKPTKRR